MTMQQQEIERSYRRPGKRTYARPQGSRCTCPSCALAYAARQTAWGAVESELAAAVAE